MSLPSTQKSHSKSSSKIIRNISRLSSMPDDIKLRLFSKIEGSNPYLEADDLSRLSSVNKEWYQILTCSENDSHIWGYLVKENFCPKPYPVEWKILNFRHKFLRLSEVRISAYSPAAMLVKSNRLKAQRREEKQIMKQALQRQRRIESVRANTRLMDTRAVLPFLSRALNEEHLTPRQLVVLTPETIASIENYYNELDQGRSLARNDSFSTVMCTSMCTAFSLHLLICGPIDGIFVPYMIGEDTFTKVRNNTASVNDNQIYNLFMGVTVYCAIAIYPCAVAYGLTYYYLAKTGRIGKSLFNLMPRFPKLKEPSKEEVPLLSDIV